MTGRKRRLFDVDLPKEAELPASSRSVRPEGRGPMATAIGEVGDALRHRSALEAEIRDENEALAAELVGLRRLGLVVELVPLERIVAAKLMRDRQPGGILELEELKASLREVGLSNPIRVEPDGQGGYELVQGLRRLTAFRELLAETGDDRWSTIPAGLLAPGESPAKLYRRMVDENLVRTDVSFAEMAMLACAYAEEGVDGCRSVDEAVGLLYASAKPQKRSYIRRFALLMMRLGKVIEHPAAIPRSLGLELADRIEHDPDAQRRLVASLRQAKSGAEAELTILRSFLAEPQAILPSPKRRGAPSRLHRQQVRIALSEGGGKATCTARGELVELRLPGRDLGALDEGKLEAAAAAFLAALDA